MNAVKEILSMFIVLFFLIDETILTVIVQKV